MTDRQWLLPLLPAFPLVLLVLRLWYLSRQNLETMLLLVQYVSPLGLLSTLTIALLWVFPATILLTRALGALLLVSDPHRAARSRLARVAGRIPDWVVVVAVVVGALTWQLRFLPTLVMATLSILGLVIRQRVANVGAYAAATGVVLPFVVALLEYTSFGPAIVDAIREGEAVTVLLLALPPAATPLLTGPVPARAAQAVTHWPAGCAAFAAPFLIGVIFLRAPILPTVAMEVDDGVLVGSVITVDDRMTTVIDTGGAVRFVLNDHVRSKTLCDAGDRPPASRVTVHGWSVERTALSWIAPARRPAAIDPRCEGRATSR
ncbi:hypothetical protein [Dactylosporangium roseum]|uniref:hypothetical protein n=1 Tax=Dactylosporangium roseum TaxID=47989 RepID=UPI0021B3A75B|nr:hypothetical protein [Dactylosporangium roseum]